MAEATEIPLSSILIFDANGKYIGTAADTGQPATGQPATNGAKNGTGFLSFLSGLSSALSPLVGSLFPSGIGGNNNTATTPGPVYIPPPQPAQAGSNNVLLIGLLLAGAYILTQPKTRK